MSPSPAVTGPAGAVDARLREFLAAERSRWGAVDAELAELVDTLAALVLAGGKRLRPAFCHWAHVGAGGDPDDPLAVDAGAALELLHAFALLHDDVMDGSDTRRGRPATHIAFAERHRARRWRGESRRFGDGVAILAGDLAFTWADQLVLPAPLAARQLFAELRLELDMGQYLDVVGTAQGGLDPARAKVVCRYKSGTYTIERPLHLGAALAGRLDELEGPLSAVGLPLGDAFQLVDDLLGAFGDEAATGKPVGGDLREGKPTLLHALAVDRAASLAGGSGAVLRDDYGRDDLDDTGVARVQQALVDSGAVAEIEALVASLVAEARTAIDALPVDEHVRSALHELAVFVSTRDR
jgi:geranylgeranyl diphosphate synthase type I